MASGSNDNQKRAKRPLPPIPFNAIVSKGEQIGKHVASPPLKFPVPRPYQHVQTTRALPATYALPEAKYKVSKYYDTLQNVRAHSSSSDANSFDFAAQRAQREEAIFKPKPVRVTDERKYRALLEGVKQPDGPNERAKVRTLLDIAKEAPGHVRHFRGTGAGSLREMVMYLDERNERLVKRLRHTQLDKKQLEYVQDKMLEAVRVCEELALLMKIGASEEEISWFRLEELAEIKKFWKTV